MPLTKQYSVGRVWSSPWLDEDSNRKLTTALTNIRREIEMGITRYLTVDGEILSETRNSVESDYIPDPLGSTAALLSTT